MRLLIVISVLLMAACNVTKTKFRQVAKVSRIVENDIKMETTTEVNTGTLYNLTRKDISLTPVDETKPITIVDPKGNKTTVTNAQVNFSATNEQKKDTTSRKKTTKIEDKSRSRENVKVKDEEKYKETVTDWKLYVIGIPIIMLLGLLIWKRKNLISWLKIKFGF